MNKRTRFALILGCISAGTLFGFFVGHFTSPDASRPGTALWCILMYGKWHRLDDQRGELTLQAGSRIYHFATGQSKVDVTYLPAWKLASQPPPKYSFDSDMEKLLAVSVAPPAEAGIWTAVLKNSETASEVITYPERIALGVATLGGFFAGYYAGHKSEPDYDNAEFEKNLESNLEMWRDFEKDSRIRYAIRVNDLLLFIINRDLADPKNAPPPKRDRKQSETAWMTEFDRLHPEIEEQAMYDPSIIRALQRRQTKP